MPIDKAAHVEICKNLYNVGMENYRYFGTLRATVSYMPAVISLTILTVLSVLKNNIVFPFLFLAFVFILIYSINIFLQAEQMLCKYFCGKCEADWHMVAAGGVLEPQRYRYYRSCAIQEALNRSEAIANILNDEGSISGHWKNIRNVFRVKPDYASRTLASFLVVVAFILPATSLISRDAVDDAPTQVTIATSCPPTPAGTPP
ncbi:hypothetical protein [Amaricoccus solimangrovi]|uniref:Uncharacterized protein n=1 Tax=Amaricoccus solimangrovi TaxID=2589815 RepID=A0A501WX77_9RHOB|nr:hypothetical protein [Amaricoccus solimangrovi]TPE53859.1 hypothetical protein FJM51_02085 [Amaricoccus solimangrovi]